MRAQGYSEGVRVHEWALGLHFVTKNKKKGRRKGGRTRNEKGRRQ